MKTHRILKASLSALLMLLLLASLLIACQTAETPEAESSRDSTSAPSAESSSDADGATTEAGSTLDPSLLPIVENGKSAYSIVCADLPSETINAAATSLFLAIKNATGVSLPYKSDFESDRIPGSEATDYEIVIGKTSRLGKHIDYDIDALSPFDYEITVIGKRILIIGGCDASTANAVKLFIEKYLPRNKVDALGIDPAISEKYVLEHNGTLTIMSQNLLHSDTEHRGQTIYGSDTEYVKQDQNTIVIRQGRFLEFLLSVIPDAVGLQECSNWHTWLDSNPALLDAGYKRIKCQKNAKISILYNTATLEPLETGSIWLTEDPENLNLSVLWGNSGNPRLAHYVRFRVKATGDTFVMVNTHIGFDNETSQLGQTGVVRDYCEQLREKYNCPVVCTGDFNFEYNTKYYTEFMKNGTMQDTKFIATESSTGTGSFNGLGHSKLANYAIDQIMVTKDDWYTFTYRVDYTTYGKHLYISDHYAVVATLKPKDLG